MAYIKDEIVVANGSSRVCYLNNRFLNGTLRIIYNGKILSEYMEYIWNRIIFDFPPAVNDEILVSYYTQNEQSKPNAVRYATARQVKLRSRANNIVRTSDYLIEKLIREAEDLIDGYCGFLTKYDQNQKLLFPRAEDSELNEKYPAIPQEITDAAILIVEQLFLQGTPSLEGTVSEERIGDYSYKKTAVKTELIPERVRLMLRGFRKLTGKINLKTE